MYDKELGMQGTGHLVWLSLWKAYQEMGGDAMLYCNLSQTFWTFKIRTLTIQLSSAMNA